MSSLPIIETFVSVWSVELNRKASKIVFTKEQAHSQSYRQGEEGGGGSRTAQI